VKNAASEAKSIRLDDAYMPHRSCVTAPGFTERPRSLTEARVAQELQGMSCYQPRALDVAALNSAGLASVVRLLSRLLGSLAIGNHLAVESVI
jgi:hypothetical protein